MYSGTLVLFDIGAVSLKIDFRRFYEQASLCMPAGSRLTPGGFKERYQVTCAGKEKEMMSGKIMPEEFLDSLREAINDTSLGYNRLAEIYCAFMTSPADEVLKIKKDVHDAGYTVGLFSNISSITHDRISRKWPLVLETYGGPRIYSHEVGDVKPKSPMYDAAAKEFDRITLIDDNGSYVSAGLSRGWNGIHFTRYIDTEESIRHVQDAGSADTCLITAGNEAELRQALIDSGINIRQQRKSRT